MAQKFNEIEPTRLKDPIKYMKNKVKESFTFFPTNSSEISSLISKLNNKKSSSYDLISNNILKETKDIITPYLEVLFNKCIAEHTFPGNFKIAQVIPLFKGGDKEDPNSYRPISLLPAIGKLFEKLWFKRLISFWTKHNIFSPHQFGFRPGFSTEHAIIDIYEKLGI